MKYLLLIFLVIPVIGVGQDGINIISSHSVPSVYIIPNDKLDTIPSSILISHKAPSFGHGIDGYCIYQYGVCTKEHLRYWRKRWIVIGPEYVVWGCVRRDLTTTKKTRKR